MAAASKTEFPFLYLQPTLRSGGFSSEPRLRDFTGRHSISLSLVRTKQIGNPIVEIGRGNLEGVLILMNSGLPDIDQLRFAEQVLSRRLRVWFYWPGESAIECIDRERIKSYVNHVMVAKAWETVRPVARLGYAVMTRLLQAGSSHFEDSVVKNCAAELSQILAGAKPVLFEAEVKPAIDAPLDGLGFYLRMDYWAPMTSGGSYGHTCYLARSLARTVQSLICLTPSHYPLLTDLGLNELVMPAPGAYTSERDLFLANAHYYPLLRRAIEIVKPAFLYERLCLGNYCSARLSQEFEIPYIVEYNGSEIEMSRTFAGHRFQHENLLVKAEEAAFRQATVISVVSEALKDELISRGIAPAKILVNPNGVDSETYAPPSDVDRAKVRGELGCDDSHAVIGFTGTFGGWHGIDVLAEAISQICKRVPSARFLLIGDGSYKHLVDSAVAQNGLDERVISRGRVPQHEGARLLRACDIFVSPHSRVMSGGRFFGSPTKLFEYMAMAGGIVASDLDQIGEVLSPALQSRDLNGVRRPVNDERAILCRPGDVSEFVNAVEYLAHHRETAKALGQNARAAAIAQYSWDRHIDRLWRFIDQGVSRRPFATRAKDQHTADFYKQELQILWGHGRSSLATKSKPHSREWFLEIEAHRTGEASWLKEIPFRDYAGKQVLEIGRGIGMDLLQFAKHNADVTYLNPSAANLTLAEENFQLRNLKGLFLPQAEGPLPFHGNTFDLVYCTELSHVAEPAAFNREVLRVLKPGGQVLAVVYAENSYHHWIAQFLGMGLISGLLTQFSIAEIISRDLGVTGNSNQVVTIYTKENLRQVFSPFGDIRIRADRMVGPNLLIRAIKPTQ